MDKYEVFVAIIKELIEIVNILISVEQDKLNTMINNKLPLIELCIKKEEACLLRLRGIEQRREEEQKCLGLANHSFQEILNDIPEKAKLVLKPLFEEFSHQNRVLYSIVDSEKDLIAVNCHIMNLHNTDISKESKDCRHFKSCSV